MIDPTDPPTTPNDYRLSLPDGRIILRANHRQSVEEMHRSMPDTIPEQAVWLDGKWRWQRIIL